MDGRLILISPYDPAARFHVGQAMQRNKLIYALSDAALIVNSDYEKGGTWAGAVEQLDKLKIVPVHVRADSEMGKGLDGLLARGARRWPEPATPEALEKILDAAAVEGRSPAAQLALSTDAGDRTETVGQVPDTAPSVERGSPAQRTSETDPPGESARSEDDRPAEPVVTARTPDPCAAVDSTPADELFARVGELIERMDGPRTEDTVAQTLQVRKKQAEDWLVRFADGKIRELFKGAGVDKTEDEIADSLQVAKPS